MQLFLCEKPAQGRDIARVVGARQVGYGHMYGNDVAVTWGVGHLLEAAPPEAYSLELKKWSLDTLPILPDTWRLSVKESAGKQLGVIAKLLQKSSEVVIATDADREGEMIAREVLEYCAYQGPVQRLWLSALNDASIKKALAEMKDGETTYPLYHSALARSRADWLIGMNMSRLFTLIAQKNGFVGVLSVGRVQTPTLKLVVDRERAINSFVAKPYYTVSVDLVFGDKSFKAQWIPPVEATDDMGRCCKKERALVAYNALMGKGEATVSDVKVKKITEVPPLPFELSQLQTVCSSRLKLGAQETLDIAQSLYETHKAISYPRTDCPYLPESMYQERMAILRNLTISDPEMVSCLKRLDTSKKSQAWNENNVAACAHHAIIPTDAKVNLSKMSVDELKVYKLIRGRYLAQFAGDFIYETIEAKLDCANEILIATGRSVKQSGWKEFVAELKDKCATLPDFKAGDLCQIKDALVEDQMTSPPPRYTEGTLLADMKNIGRFVTDKRLKAKLSETAGIGTNATRGAIIKGLIDRRYLKKIKNSLFVTPNAMALIDAVPADISDPATTAIWEQALELISKGKLGLDEFVSRQKAWVAGMVKHHKEQTLTVMNSSAPKCPQCKQPMVRRHSKLGDFWGCSQYPTCQGMVLDVGGKPAKAKVLTRGVIRRPTARKNAE